jgi:hypothetical protein
LLGEKTWENNKSLRLHKALLALEERSFLLSNRHKSSNAPTSVLRPRQGK